MTRSRITDQVIAPGAARLVLLRAPAGFGKTTLLAQARQRLVESGVVTAWLTLDATDNDLPRFVAYLQVVVEKLEAQARIAGPSHSEDSALGWVERIASLDIPFVIFIDEMDVVHSDSVLAVLTQLVDHLPRSGRLVIGSRTQTGLRLARLRATGQLVEIDAATLRFSLQETTSFFQRRQASGLGAGELELLQNKTEGWAAALWLAWLALERTDKQAQFIAAFSGSEAGLAGYLAEEVLSRQTERVRQFLLRTSILSEISMPLCHALLPDSDSAGILREISAANVFLIPLEGQVETWRYHALFAEFLRAELAREFPADVSKLHEAAAAEFLRQDRAIPAIEHLLAGGQAAQAVALLQSEAMPLLMQGRLGLLTRWHDAVPAALLDRAPRLRIAFAWAIGYTRGPSAAIALLDSSGLAELADEETQAHLRALRASLLSRMERWEEAYAAAHKALEAVPTSSPFADASVTNVAAMTATVLGLFDKSRHMVDRVRESQGQAPSPFQKMYTESVEGLMDLLEGRFRQAQARFRLALQTSKTVSVNAAHGNAWAGLLYAVSIYETGDVRQALQLLEIYLPLSRAAWLPDHTILGYVLLSRIAFQDGKVDEAFERISELENLGHERVLPRLVAAARMERAWVQLKLGHVEASAAELVRCRESCNWDDIRSRWHLAHDWDDLEIAQARWQLLAGDPKLSRARLKALIAEAELQHRARRLLKLRLLHALACAASGDQREAVDTALALMKATSLEGVISMFVEEGKAAAVLIQHAQTLVLADADPMLADYVQRLLAAFGPLASTVKGESSDASESAKISEPLTAKEIRLLQMLAEGYSNKALADKLCVSDSTVRTHLRNINLKLGARNRTQAVALARKHAFIR